MLVSIPVRAGGLVVALLLALGGAHAAQADTSVGGTNVWTMVGSPSFGANSVSPYALVSYSNHLPVEVSGLVIMVLRNNSHQTVYFSTATATISPGSIVVADLAAFGLAAGTYNATFFAFSFSGVAISLSTSAPFTIPG